MALKMDPALEYTSPENRGVCGFCGGEEGGYAKKDSNGKWRAACWACVKPADSDNPQPKRKKAAPPPPEIDMDVEKPQPKRAPGIPPSTHRPKVL